MNLLGKFEQVQFEDTDKISGEDLAELQKYQQIFDNSKNYILKLTGFLDENKRVRETYIGTKQTCITQGFLDSRIKAYLVREGQNFNNAIVQYFETKYLIDLKKYKVEDLVELNSRREEEHNHQYEYYFGLDYKKVLNKILSELGGLNFKEKLDQEVKDTLGKLCFSVKNDRAILKNKVISLNIGLRLESRKTEVRSTYSCSAEMTALVKAISHFEDFSGIIPELERYTTYTLSLPLDKVGTSIKIEATSKVESLKFYKNGKIDLKFYDCEQAFIFAKEYCKILI